MIQMLHMNCMDYMKGQPDKSFELAIVDPPYGINAEQGTNSSTRERFKDRKGDSWDSAPPSPEYFAELKRVSVNQIIWGGNYFDLGTFRHFVVWDKGIRGLCFGDCELAVGSFDKPPRVFTHNPTLPKNRMDKIHPTQKPVALYKWLLTKYAKQGDRILDTHGGSGAICIAAHDLGFDLTWMELDAGYYATACERFKNHTDQLVLFEPDAQALQQGELL